MENNEYFEITTKENPEELLQEFQVIQQVIAYKAYSSNPIMYKIGEKFVNYKEEKLNIHKNLGNTQVNPFD